jgi:hypothetical protein
LSARLARSLVSAARIGSGISRNSTSTPASIAAHDFALPAFLIADVVERHFDALAARDRQGHATFFDSLTQPKRGPRTKPLTGL